MGKETFVVDNNTPHPPPPSMTDLPPVYDETRAMKYARQEQQAERAVGDLSAELFNHPIVLPRPKYDVFPVAMAERDKPQLAYAKFSRHFSNGRPITGYLAVLENPMNHFGIFPAPGSRVVHHQYTCTLHKTSETAAADKCLFAINAGFFNMQTGACLGNVVHNSSILQIDNRDKKCNFGITQDGEYVTGYLSDADVRHLRFAEVITGKGWLIRNGTSFLAQSLVEENIDHRFETIKAPRSGVGFDKDGRLMLLSVDGEEDVDEGADMHEFTELFLSLGAVNAVNLDGGGSGTVWYHGAVASRPTCDDTPVICERPVTTIACVY
jgi:N-acetylglucosamine-1-phosphodiester alpha-N-acetylglucosaminidase